MKLVRYNERDRRGNLPSGYHSAEWYKNRGYSLKQNTYRERDGDTRGRESSRSGQFLTFRWFLRSGGSQIGRCTANAATAVIGETTAKRVPNTEASEPPSQA